LRKHFADGLLGQAIDLSVHTHTSYPEALRLPLSHMRAFYESNEFSTMMKSREAMTKLQVSVIQAINQVVLAINKLGKLMAGRR
jgi:hypothetical protein